MDLRKIHYKQIFMDSLPVLILLCFTWIRASAMLARVTDPDPGLFETFAYHLQQGKTLYADIWDHKPPLIFYLNLWFLQLFGISEDAISFGSLVFCLLQTLVFYLLLIRLVKNKVSAFIGTAIFITLYYSVYIFGSGNYTEQYGVLCTSAGLLFFLDYLDKKHTLSLWISGIVFGIAVWFKEPFLFSAAPYFIFLGIQSIRKKTKWLHLFEFGLAFMVPALIIANVIVLTGSKEGFLEQFVHSWQYAKSSNTTPLLTKLFDNRLGFFGVIPIANTLLIILYFMCLGFLFLKSRHRIFIVLIASQQFFDYFATGMSGNRFFHYYLQTFPLMLFIIVSAISMGAETWLWLRNKKLHFIPLGIFGLFIFSKINPWTDVALNPKKTFQDPIVDYLNQNEFYKPRSVAMGGKDIGFYLLRVQGISQVKHIVPYPHHWIQIPGKEKHFQMHEDKERFLEWNPDYVIYSGHFSEMYQDCQLDSFILKNYYEVASTNMMSVATAHLLKRRDGEKTE